MLGFCTADAFPGRQLEARAMISPELKKVAEEHLADVNANIKKFEEYGDRKSEEFLKILRDHKARWEKVLGD